MIIPDSYIRAFVFLDRLWEQEHDDDLGALLGGMQLCDSDVGPSPFDPAFLEDWNIQAHMIPDDDGYETLVRFLRAKADWSPDSGYISRLADRMAKMEREQMLALWRSA